VVSGLVEADSYPTIVVILYWTILRFRNEARAAMTVDRHAMDSSFLCLIPHRFRDKMRFIYKR